jgi:ribonuclease HI
MTPARKLPILPQIVNSHCRSAGGLGIPRTPKMQAWFDGAAAPTNPGPSGSGWVLKKEDGETIEGYQYHGIQTNNFAEYQGLINLLELIGHECPDEPVLIRGDSQLVINQVQGNWKCGSPNLKPLHKIAVEALVGLNVTFEWVRRDKNEHADRLSKVALSTKSECRDARTEGSGFPPIGPDTEWILALPCGEPHVPPRFVRVGIDKPWGPGFFDGLEDGTHYVDVDELGGHTLKAPINVIGTVEFETWGV